jgi:cell division transport system permease protein
VRIGTVVSEASIGLRRNLVMSTAAVITIAVSLTFVGAALLVRQSVDRLQDAFFTEIEVAVYLDDGVTAPQREEINRTLQALPLVEKVTYASKQDAYERFLRQNPNDPDISKNVTPDLLPEAFLVQLKDPEQFEIVSSAATDLPGVDEVDDNRDELKGLFGVLNGLNLLAAATAVVQAIAAVLLIANTVRLTAFSRRREIGVMRLVGATRWSIQLPFLIEGVIVGLLGTALAGGLLAAGKRFLIDDKIEGLFTFAEKPSWSDIFLTQGPILLALGLLVSALASIGSMFRYVRV